MTAAAPVTPLSAFNHSPKSRTTPPGASENRANVTTVFVAKGVVVVNSPLAFNAPNTVTPELKSPMFVVLINDQLLSNPSNFNVIFSVKFDVLCTCHSVAKRKLKPVAVSNSVVISPT